MRKKAINYISYTIVATTTTKTTNTEWKTYKQKQQKEEIGRNYKLKPFAFLRGQKNNMHIFIYIKLYKIKFYF